MPLKSWYNNAPFPNLACFLLVDTEDRVNNFAVTVQHLFLHDTSLTPLPVIGSLFGASAVQLSSLDSLLHPNSSSNWDTSIATEHCCMLHLECFTGGGQHARETLLCTRNLEGPSFHLIAAASGGIYVWLFGMWHTAWCIAYLLVPLCAICIFSPQTTVNGSLPCWGWVVIQPDHCCQFV